MKTYLTVHVNSEGERPSVIVDRLYNMGFKACKGNYDFEYEWNDDTDVKQVIFFADKVHAALEGTKVLFHTETVGDQF